MPSYIGTVIDQINYNSNFNYNIDMLPNPASQEDANACRQYKMMIEKHVIRVIETWLKDSRIEDKPILKFNSSQSEGWGDYIVEPTSHTHDATWSLKKIAEEEYNIDPKIKVDVDTVIRVHDRSRFSEDEFFPSANHFFGTDDVAAFQIAELKHYQRNSHEFIHYVIPDVVTCDMPEVFFWERMAVWLSNFEDPDYKYNLNNGYNPFQYYWGKDSNYKWIWVVDDPETGDGHWEKVRDTSGPVLPNKVKMSASTRSRIEKFVDRWSQVIPMP